VRKGFEHLITGVTAKLPGDWAKHEAQFRPGSVSQVAALAEVQTPKRARGRVRHRAGQIRIVIPGPPPGKPRMTQRDKWAKRPEVVRYRDWCDLVRATAGKDVPDASLVRELNWTAYFEPPQSWSMKTRAAVIGTCHRQKPDRDNIDKAILDIPVTLSVQIGNTKISIRNLLQLNQGSVVELDRLAGEPLDVLVNGTLVAHGEVVVVNEKFGIRLTDVVSAQERVRKLQ